MFQLLWTLRSCDVIQLLDIYKPFKCICEWRVVSEKPRDALYLDLDVHNNRQTPMDITVMRNVWNANDDFVGENIFSTHAIALCEIECHTTSTVAEKRRAVRTLSSGLVEYRGDCTLAPRRLCDCICHRLSQADKGLL